MKFIALIATVMLLSTQVSAQCISGDCENGKGVYRFPNQAQYVGDFQNGMLHGEGTCYYPDESRYIGQWAYRFPHGEGTMTFADGTQVSGIWDNGILVDENGEILEDEMTTKAMEDINSNLQTGCLSGDCEHGEGTYAYADGSRYEGSFVNGKKHGLGTFFYANGNKYIGHFMFDQYSGTGKMMEKEGDVIEGLWAKGELKSANDNNGDRDKVEYRDCSRGDCMSGLGTFFYNEGKFVGEFLNGMPIKGTIYFHNGDKYTGELKNHTFHGWGVLYHKKFKNEIKGYWENSAYIGKKRKDNPPKTQPSPPPAKSIPQIVKKQRVWAVVVGVSTYTAMPSLKFTDDDAYRMYAFFKSPEGGALPDDQISILIDEDANREKILSTMNRVFTQAGRDDLVILYFSGHGLKGSFLPSDFDGYGNKILHEEINQIFESSPARHKLCIADACHSGGLLASRGAISGTLETYYNRLAQSQGGTALIMSSKSEETSLESNGLRQGVFSHFLLRGLKGEADSDGDMIIEITELFKYINAQVTEYTGRRQTPVLKGRFDENMPIGVVRLRE